MNHKSDHDPAGPQDEPVRRIISAFQRRRDAGDQVTTEELVAENPAHADALRRYFASTLDRVDQTVIDTKPEDSEAVMATFIDPDEHDRDSALKAVKAVMDAVGFPRQFGRYKILKELGHGGMGAVYLAIDEQLERHIALKMPRFDVSASATTIGRFYREAKAAATLRHPGICPVFDVGEIEGQHYITMAYIDGRPLNVYTESTKRQDVHQVVRLIRKLAIALTEAHRHKVVHRDLKPANIMIDSRGEPVIMDFGLAQRAADGEEKLTRARTFLGTPAYMSPEQIAGENELVGPQSDIFSLGIVFYELLAGRRPFQGNLTSIIKQIAVDEPEPPSRIGGVPTPELDAICMKMIAKSLHERYASMQQVSGELSEFLKESRRKSSAIHASRPFPGYEPEAVIPLESAASPDDHDAEIKDNVTLSGGISLSSVLKHGKVAGPILLGCLVFVIGLVVTCQIGFRSALLSELNEVRVIIGEAPFEERQLDAITLSGSVYDPSLEPRIEFETFERVPEPLFPSYRSKPPDEENSDVFSTAHVTDVEVPALPGRMLSGRTGAMKIALLAIYGGTAETQEAVSLGLEWLKRNQRKNGSWSMRGPYKDGGLTENDCAATAMALMAFLGDGHTHKQGDYVAQVEKGIKFLIGLQDRGGFFARGAQAREQMFAQAQATIAICELYGMTNDSWLRPKAQLAIDFATDAQYLDGGWGLEPNSKSDTAVTGWFVMALRVGRDANLAVAVTVLTKNVNEYLDAASSFEDAAYGAHAQSAPSPAMTAEGLLCRQYIGWERAHPPLQRGIEALLLDAPFGPSDRDVYYWYFAAQLLRNYGGSHWRVWNDVMRVDLPRTQTKAGREAGSWAPQSDRWGRNTGRLYTTCMSVFCLQTYYRHMPKFAPDEW